MSHTRTTRSGILETQRKSLGVVHGGRGQEWRQIENQYMYGHPDATILLGTDLFISTAQTSWMRMKGFDMCYHILRTALMVS